MNPVEAIQKLRDVLRRRHLALTTEENYVQWLARFMGGLGLKAGSHCTALVVEEAIWGSPWWFVVVEMDLDSAAVEDGTAAQWVGRLNAFENGYRLGARLPLILNDEKAIL